MQNLITSLMIFIFTIAVMTFVSIMVLIKGWGLEPQSWWWIIGVGVAGQIFLRIMGATLEQLNKNTK